jgi:hypothetical protein
VVPVIDLGMTPVGRTVALVLAQDPAPPPGKGDEFGKASPVGLVVILLLLIATAFLIRSMTKHLKRVPESFDPPAPRSGPPRPPGADAPDPDSGAPRPGDVETFPDR